MTRNDRRAVCTRRSGSLKRVETQTRLLLGAIGAMTEVAAVGQDRTNVPTESDWISSDDGCHGRRRRRRRGHHSPSGNQRGANSEGCENRAPGEHAKPTEREPHGCQETAMNPYRFSVSRYVYPDNPASYAFRRPWLSATVICLLTTAFSHSRRTSPKSRARS